MVPRPWGVAGCRRGCRRSVRSGATYLLLHHPYALRFRLAQLASAPRRPRPTRRQRLQAQAPTLPPPPPRLRPPVPCASATTTPGACTAQRVHRSFFFSPKARASKVGQASLHYYLSTSFNLISLLGHKPFLFSFAPCVPQMAVADACILSASHMPNKVIFRTALHTRPWPCPLICSSPPPSLHPHSCQKCF